MESSLPKPWQRSSSPASCAVLNARLEAADAWDQSSQRRAGFSLKLHLGRWHAPAALHIRLPWESLGPAYPLPHLQTVEYDLQRTQVCVLCWR